MIRNGLETRYRPIDNYKTMQNPPDFSWEFDENACAYDLIVCKDKELNDIAYQKNNCKTNYFNFPIVFETGYYYWSVRSITKNKESCWQPPRRFLISPDACEFPVPDIDTLMSRINKNHPRIYTNLNELNDFRIEMLSPDNIYFPVLTKMVMDFMKNPFPTEQSMNPMFVDLMTMYSPFVYSADNTKYACNSVMLSAFYYLITQDKEVGEFAVKSLLKMAELDPSGVTSYHLNDQAHRRIAVSGALAYDWLRELLSKDERQKVLDMLEKRVSIMFSSDNFNISEMDISPFDSHGGTAIGYVILIGLALYGEVKEADKWLRYALPLYINYMYPWSIEDGGWAQGTYYWSCGFFGQKVMEALLSTGVINLYDKAWQKNEILYPIYCWPEGSIGGFGDNSYILPTNKNATLISMIAYRTNTPQAKWMRNQLGYMTAYGHTDDPDPSVCCHDKLYSESEAYLPKDFPKDHFFKDVGITAMHTDLADIDRISVLFRSSWYGSYNHSHPDQNSFIIHAFGEALAIDSGYYDLYNYPFDKDYTRKTYAHNAITYGNGNGQPSMDIMAKGEITHFVTSKDFCLSTGDATKAYNGKLKKAIRHLVYIKPDFVIIIDDLAINGNEKETFEFFLNAQKHIKLYDDKKGGKIVNNKASLDVQVQYPNDVTGFFSNDFSSPDGPPLYPIYEGHARWPIQKRMWFQTQPVLETVIVTTLDIHKTKKQAKKINRIETKEYIQLSLEDGTIILINLINKNTICAFGFSFSGTALVIGNDSLLFINGTYLSKNEKELIVSDKKISVAINPLELSLSSINYDSKVKIYIGKDKKAVDLKGREITKDSQNLGITASSNDCFMEFSMYNGNYDLKLIDFN